MRRCVISNLLYRHSKISNFFGTLVFLCILISQRLYSQVPIHMLPLIIFFHGLNPCQPRLYTYFVKMLVIFLLNLLSSLVQLPFYALHRLLFCLQFVYPVLAPLFSTIPLFNKDDNFGRHVRQVMVSCNEFLKALKQKATSQKVRTGMHRAGCQESKKEKKPIQRD